MKGILSISQVLYFGFGVMALIAVVYLMTSFYLATKAVSSEVAMDDVLKTLDSASTKLYFEGLAFNAENSRIYLKLPAKVAGSKYRIKFNNTSREFCFVFPETRCKKTYLLAGIVQINADIDSSKSEHYMYYLNKTIQVV
ncbi:MAG: hypothetical protein QXO69_00155 [archaeon]